MRSVCRTLPEERRSGEVLVTLLFIMVLEPRNSGVIARAMVT